MNPNQPIFLTGVISPPPSRTVTNPVRTSTARVSSGTGQVLRLPIAADAPDAFGIVAHLENLSNQFGREPYIREFTVNRVLCSPKDNDTQRNIRDVLWFVRTHLKYVPDPDGAEYVVSPVRLLQQLLAGQPPKGDCDDHVLLLNSMLLSIGIPAKVVGVSLYDQSRFDHVISSVYTGNRWEDMDPCAKEGFTPQYRNRLINP
jgi:transglutaminase-like putative cysteine protease